MKKIEAIIRLSRFEKIRAALAEIGIRFFTMHEVKGYGLQKGETLTYRGSIYDADYIPRMQLDILCTEDNYQKIIEVIVQAGKTGEVGDGKIISFDINQVTRIRTSETGEAAL